MEINETIELGVQKFLNGEGTVSEISRKLKLDSSKLLYNRLLELGYKAGKGIKSSYVIALKQAVDEYVLNINYNPSLTKIGEKYGIERHSLSRRLKELGYSVINHQNKVKFNEHIFDVVDTEEKAYWLGFIWADGCIDSSPLDPSKKSVYNFELSLKADDISHLEKFNKFMEHINNNVKISNTKCGEKICKRCRWFIANKHLWNVLNNLGCVPKKSLTLQFPDESIFKSRDLIRHFIRGYFDGDGCLTWRNSEHTIPSISVLGTENVLNGVKRNIPGILNYSLQLNNKENEFTKVLSIDCKTAFNVINYLYSNSTIYLQRKYEKYLEYCRLYEKSYRGLEGKNGEPCDGNTVLNSEISQGSESV